MLNLAKSLSSSFLGESQIAYIFTFVVIETLISNFISVPFDYYKTFVIEEKHGFNKSTITTFLTDMVKSMMLTVVFMPLVNIGAIWIIDNGGDNLIWYLWFFGVAIILSFMLIWPIFIAPLFNKFV